MVRKAFGGDAPVYICFEGGHALADVYMTSLYSLSSLVTIDF